LDVVVDGAFERCQRAANFGRGGWLVGFEQRPEEPVLQLGVEDCDADTVGVRT
jgi:hypothetical protein